MKRFKITIVDEDSVVLDQVEGCYREDRLTDRPVWLCKDPFGDDAFDEDDLIDVLLLCLDAAWGRKNIIKGDST